MWSTPAASRPVRSRLAIDGGGPSDALVGGLGDDVLFGGGGMDGCLFNTALNAANNIDSIVGYSVADDTIRLDNVIFTTLADGALGAPAFFIGAAAHDADDRIIYNSATGAPSFDADGNAGGAALIQFATLSSGLALTSADFFFV